MPKKVTKTKAVKLPMVLRDRTNSIASHVIAMQPSFGGARCIYQKHWSFELVDFVALWDHIDLPDNPGGHYAPNLEITVSEALSEFRTKALEHGAAPEAIRLLGAISPWTAKEEATLAEKLKSKAAATKSGTKEKAAKPVGGGGKAAETKPKRGNPEALAKAREARAASGPDVRKITILNKENPYRADTNRALAFDALKGAKTVEDYEKAGGRRKYLSRWVSEGRISLK